MKTKITYSTQKAFSMLELIFVIVILGIVASIGSSLIARTFESHIVQRALHRASLSTELAATQLVNRLTFRIKDTTIARNPNNVNDWLTVTSIGGTGDNIHTALEWIGYDDDSFSARTVPGWSGYADVQNASVAGFATPGSNLGTVNSIIRSLSNNEVALTTAGQRPAIFFNASGRSDQYRAPSNALIYAASCLGMDYATNDVSCVLAVSGTDNVGAADTFTFATAPHDTNPKTIYEHYKLAWSAYAVVPVQVTGTDLIDRGFQAGDMIFDLRFFYNYQPWLGEQYDTHGSSSILISNVSVFKFSESGGTVRFKICTQQNIAGNRHATVCKEKAVIR